MASEQIPINHSIIKWARERAGFSLDELKKDFRYIEDWEKGSSFPTYNQLEKFSDKVKCPIAVFFFPEPPKIEPLRKSFRTLPDFEYELLPTTVRLLLRQAKAMQLNLAELDSEDSLSDKKIVKSLNFDINAPIQTIANEVRDFLGVSLDVQFSWTSIEEALENWRHIFAKNGIFVFKEAFRTSEYSGFCLYDPDFPIIYINNSTTKTRQIFTLFHELAHLIFKTSGIDKLNDDFVGNLEKDEKKIEILCNKFASVFLVPDKNFDLLIGDKKFKIEEVEILSETFKVSREVILRKFLDRQIISKSYYDQKVGEWINQLSGTKKDGGNYYYTQIAYLGNDYVNIALKQFYQNKFDEVKLADYLNIKPKNLEKFQDKFLRRTGV